jgi:predicted HTH domain antitoxin
MLQITLEIPDDTSLALKVAPDHLAQELQLAAAVKLYELRRLSSGAAARLAGIPRTVFLMRLADYGVDTFDLTETELEQEVATTRCLAGG